MKLKLMGLLAVLFTLTACTTTVADTTSANEKEVIVGNENTRSISHSIVKDRETGCEYIQSEYDDVHAGGVSLTPRLSSNGLPICRK